MTEAPEIIKLVLDRGLSPFLKQNGFRKNGTHFSRTCDEALQLINLQSSQWNNSSSAKFTLNIGVHFSRVARILRGTDTMREPPKEYYCLMRRRVGELLPEGTDRWWTVTPETSAEALTKELAAICQDFVFPWLDKVKTLSGAATEMERSRNWELWQAAGARVILGDLLEASLLVTRMIEGMNVDRDATHPSNADLKAKRIQDLRDWAARQKLPGF